MSPENSDSKLDLKKVAEELDTARKLALGIGATPGLITSENFPLLAENAPGSLDVIRGLAELGFKSDVHKLVIIQEMPIELWSIIDDKERNWLYTAAEFNLLEPATDLLKDRYKKEIEDHKNRQDRGERNPGFRV